MFHCIYVPQFLYPFICWWISRLLPCPGYCKQCCSEQWGACVFFNYGFLRVYAQSLEKEIGTYCSILAWKTPQMGKPDGLHSTGSQRVRHNWATNIHMPRSGICWRGCEEKRIRLHRWWECKLIQSLWRTGWMFLNSYSWMQRLISDCHAKAFVWSIILQGWLPLSPYLGFFTLPPEGTLKVVKGEKDWIIQSYSFKGYFFLCFFFSPSAYLLFFHTPASDPAEHQWWRLRVWAPLGKI